ncbi:MAG: pilus assembly protein PilM [Clostridium sp.]
MGNLLSIVINNNHMKIAELSNGKKGVSVSRLFAKEVPQGMMEEGTIRDVRAFSEYLTATLFNAGIKSKRVIFSLPSDKILTKEIILPDMDDEKIRTTLKANASEYFPIDLSDYVLSYFLISKILKEDDRDRSDDEEDSDHPNDKKNKKKRKEKKNKKDNTQLRLMVLAAPNVMVQSYYDAAKLSHLKVESIDYIGNSAFQLSTEQIGEEPCLVVQLDVERTILTIYQNHVMTLQRYVDFGCMAVIQTVAEQDHSSPGEAEKRLEQESLLHDNFDDGDTVTESLYYLIGNIKRVIEYYAGRNADYLLERIYVMGEGAAMQGLGELLEHQLNLPVQTMTTLKQVFIKDKVELSIAEVLKYMDNIGAAMAPVDFIPKQLEQDMRRKIEAKAYRVMILLALFTSLLMVTVASTKFFSVGIDTLDLKNRLMVTEDVKPILDNYRQSVLRYGDVQTVQTTARTKNAGLGNFIRIFEQLRPSNISISSFSCNEGEVSFSALADSKKTVAKLIMQLNTIANVSEVKVNGLSSSFEGAQETVSFSVTCKLTHEDELLPSGVKAEAETVADTPANPEDMTDSESGVAVQ